MIGPPTVRRIGEVVESTSTSFVAQCYRLESAPALGGLVRTDSPDIYGVVGGVTTEPLDSARPVLARGEDADTEEDVIRDLILAGTRADGRKADELRNIECYVDLMPRSHGSALFQRGETQALVSITLGTSRDEQRVDGLMEAAIDLLSQNGATIIDPIPLQSKQYNQAEFEVLLFEFKDGLNRYLSQVDQSHPIHSLQELIEFNNQHQQTVMPYFGQEILEMAQEKAGLDDRAYRAALKRCQQLSRQTGIDAIMTTHQLLSLIHI